VPKFTRFVASLYASGVQRTWTRTTIWFAVPSAAAASQDPYWRKQTAYDAWVARLIAQVGHSPDPDGPAPRLTWPITRKAT